MKELRAHVITIRKRQVLGAAILVSIALPCGAAEPDANAATRARAMAVFERLQGALRPVRQVSAAKPRRTAASAKPSVNTLSALPKLMGGAAVKAAQSARALIVPPLRSVVSKPYAAIGGFAPMSAPADRVANYAQALEGIASVPSLFGDLSSVDAIEAGAESGSRLGTALDALGPIGVAAGALGGYETGGVKGALFNVAVGGSQYGAVEGIEAAGLDASGPETFGIGVAVGTGVDFGLRMSQCGATWACVRSCGAQAINDQIQPYVAAGQLIYSADPQGFNAAGRDLASAGQSVANTALSTGQNAVAALGQAAGGAVASLGSLFGL